MILEEQLRKSKENVIEWTDWLNTGYNKNYCSSHSNQQTLYFTKQQMQTPILSIIKLQLISPTYSTKDNAL